MIELDLEPQKMILSQKFRHLMRCKKYTINKNFLPCLVSEIQLFVYILRGENQNSGWGSIFIFALKCQQTTVFHYLHI